MLISVVKTLNMVGGKLLCMRKNNIRCKFVPYNYDIGALFSGIDRNAGTSSSIGERSRNILYSVLRGKYKCTAANGYWYSGSTSKPERSFPFPKHNKHPFSPAQPSL